MSLVGGLAGYGEVISTRFSNCANRSVALNLSMKKDEFSLAIVNLYGEGS